LANDVINESNRVARPHCISARYKPLGPLPRRESATLWVDDPDLAMLVLLRRSWIVLFSDRRSDWSE
jgi:hypothetical protein